MENKVIIAIIIIVLLVVGGYFLINANKPVNEPTQQTNQPQQNPVIDVQVQTIPKVHEITYTNSGYSPSTLTIKTGDTVVFKNQSSGGMWTGSAMHPTHTAYSNTSLQQHCPDPENNDFDQCKSTEFGTSWSFTFTKAGTFGYHNHVKANQFGKIIVE